MQPRAQLKFGTFFRRHVYVTWNTFYFEHMFNTLEHTFNLKFRAVSGLMLFGGEV
jgi:hypothetical protein